LLSLCFFNADSTPRGGLGRKRRVRAAFVPRSGTNALRGEAAQLHAAAKGGCMRAHAPRREFLLSPPLYRDKKLTLQVRRFAGWERSRWD